MIGDDRDMMGQAGTGHERVSEGTAWLAQLQPSPAIQTVSASGSYRISAFEGGSSPSALKILKSATASDKTFYYVEARTSNGFDGPYSGVILHTGNWSNGRSGLPGGRGSGDGNV